MGSDDTKADDRALIELGAMEMAARYLRTNGVSAPLAAAGIAAILSNWFAPIYTFAWFAATLVSANTLAFTLHRFRRDTRRATRLRAWTRAIFAASFFGSLVFSSFGLLFYLPGERLNNMLVVGVLVGALTLVAAMAAPSARLAAVAITPHSLTLLSVLMFYEPFPISLALSGIALVFIGVTFVFVLNVRGLAHDSLALKLHNERLIEGLVEAKARSEAEAHRAETASRAKSTFLANMSHELRTPLNAILGFSEIIRDQIFGGGAISRYASYAGDIHNSGVHLLALVNDVLDLSRIEAGRLELHEELVHLDEIAAHSFKLVAHRASAKDLRLEAATALPSMIADRRAIQQVLVNLLTNAVKFTPEGGQVGLKARDGEDGSLVLTVWDTGIGIPIEDQARVLETFGRARHEIRRADDDGVGLGLPIARGLVEAHGGTLALESRPGKGTSVHVVLPAFRVTRAGAVPRAVAAY